MHRDTALLAVDWGSSSLRGARLDGAGRVLEQRVFAQGVLSVAPGQFAGIFESAFGDWRRASGAPCLISGMAGSQQGWQEAAYCACPAGFDELAAQLSPLAQEPGCAPIALVPGLRCDDDCALAGLERVPDVMRGEEVQIFGAMQITGLRDGLFVLPGTHSKWARVAAARVTAFKTYMSGEFFALLRQHSMLARSLDASAEHDSEAFARGVQRSAQGAGLLHDAFGVRTLSLFGHMDAAALQSYLSGLLIGAEISAQSLRSGTEVILIGARALTTLYAQALALHSVGCVCLDEQATWAGLFALSHGLSTATP